MLQYIIIIVLIIIILYLIFWEKKSGFLSIPADSFSARGGSYVQRNNQVNEQVGAAGVSNLGETRYIGQIRGAYGVPARTLITNHPQASRVGPYVGRVTIPILPIGGFSPFA